MKILLTNDDGYRAKGLRAMAEALAKKGHSVCVVAPQGQQSAVSHAVTLHKALRLVHVEKYDTENIKVFFTNGTPTDSAMLGLFDIMPDADLLISGINSGPNLAEDVIYSGTVGAAMEGALIGKPSIAVSLCRYGTEEYELAALFTAGIADQVPGMGLPQRTVLNINVPPVKASEYKGFRVVPLGHRKYKDVLEKRTDPRGADYYWIAGEIIRDINHENTDVAVVEQDMISVTPLTLDFTDTDLLRKLNFREPL